MAMSATADKYLPTTISLSSIGSVEIISIVPSPFSLDMSPIVIPGIKNRYTKGTILKSVLKSD